MASPAQSPERAQTPKSSLGQHVALTAIRPLGCVRQEQFMYRTVDTQDRARNAEIIIISIVTVSVCNNFYH